MNAIKVSNLTKKYHDFTAVNHVSFEVAEGTMLGFLGVNGAGKTTVINMLATLLAPDGGEAEICGEMLGKGDEEIRRNIGIVYQQNCLDDILTVGENLICRGILHGISKAEAKKQCRKLGEILKLDEILEKRYRMLSGGQKRRVEIAAALMHTPRILFLDEPTTGLDPATRLDVWDTVEQLQRDEKMTVFLTTHYMEEAAAADQIIIMDKGNIITSGTPFELKEKYAADRLKLYCKAGKSEEALKRLPGTYSKARLLENHIIELFLPSTMAALPAVVSVEGMIDGFEVIQGNMDDVFLNSRGAGHTDETADLRLG